MTTKGTRLIGVLCGLASLTAATMPLEPPVGLSWPERVIAVIAGVGAIALALTLREESDAS